MNLSLVQVRDVRSDVKHQVEADALIYKGASRISEQRLPATAWNQAGPPIATQWVVTPKTTDIVDRYIKMRFYYTITANADWKVGDWDALRQFPTHSILETINVRINGVTVSDTISDKLHAMLCYGNTPADRVKAWSTTAAQPDQYQEYNINLGSARNVFCQFGENSTEVSRGAFTEVYVNPTDDPKVLNVVVTEPLLISPFLNGIGQQEEGFINVDHMDINLLYRPDVSRIMSHSILSTSNITSVTVTQNRGPELLYNLITPRISQMLPAMQVLPYSNLNTTSRTFNFTSLNEVQTCSSESYKLSIVPHAVYLFGKRSRPTQSFSTADSFCGIERIRIQYNTEQLFSNSSTQELFDISRQNGVNLSYSEWSKYRGSVLKLEFGKDIGLAIDEAPGVQAQGTIQFEVDFKNLSATPTLAFEFFVVFQYNGTIRIAENSAMVNIGTLTKSDVIRSDSAPVVASDHPDLEGGSFWTKLKAISNKIARVVSPVARVVGDVASKLGQDDIATTARTIQRGADYVRSKTGGRLLGTMKAGTIVGGEMPSISTRKLVRRR